MEKDKSTTLKALVTKKAERFLEKKNANVVSTLTELKKTWKSSRKRQKQKSKVLVRN